MPINTSITSYFKPRRATPYPPTPAAQLNVRAATRLPRALEIESSPKMDLRCFNRLSRLRIVERTDVYPGRESRNFSPWKVSGSEHNPDFSHLRVFDQGVFETTASLGIVYRPFIFALTGPE
jgi:hypothetical protein